MNLAILFLILTFEQAKPIASFHNCRIDGGTGNHPHYQDMTELYKCDEGRIELKGRWSEAIEYGAVFSTRMGRPDGEPHMATKDDYEMFKWCANPQPWDKNQKELCGPKPPKKCWDGKPPTFDSTGVWACLGSNK